VEKDVFEVPWDLKMRVKRDDCAAPSAGDVRKSAPIVGAARRQRMSTSRHQRHTDELRMEINLIGRTVDEATEELEKYWTRFSRRLPASAYHARAGFSPRRARISEGASSLPWC